jgi:hypothetical protein
MAMLAASQAVARFPASSPRLGYDIVNSLLVDDESKDDALLHLRWVRDDDSAGAKTLHEANDGEARGLRHLFRDVVMALLVLPCLKH